MARAMKGLSMCTLYLCAIVRVCRREQPANPLISRNGLCGCAFAHPPTRSAAAGGYTMLVDMPLNCLPATTNVGALEAKRAAAQAKCHVDWAAWGGVVHDNQNDIEALAAAGVPGFKCFLVHPGIDGFTMVTEQQLRASLPHIARTGLALLVHAELPGPIDAATGALADAHRNCYSTYLQSRPDDAERSAIRMMLSLCREYGFRLHIVHLSTSLALEE